MKVNLWHAKFRNYIAMKSNIVKYVGLYSLKICIHTSNMYTHFKNVYTLQICIHTSNMYTHFKYVYTLKTYWLLNIICQKSGDLRQTRGD